MHSCRPHGAQAIISAARDQLEDHQFIYSSNGARSSVNKSVIVVFERLLLCNQLCKHSPIASLFEMIGQSASVSAVLVRV